MKKTKTNSAEMPEKTVYVGPTIPGVATRNTVYGEIPKALQKAIKARPYLKSLCVPISGLSKATTQIERKQGGIYALYIKALRESAIIQKGVN